jgi:hypothetical protein
MSMRSTMCVCIDKVEGQFWITVALRVICQRDAVAPEAIRLNIQHCSLKAFHSAVWSTHHGQELLMALHVESRTC